MQIPQDHLIIDTRASPTGSFIRTGMNEIFAESDTAIDGFAAFTAPTTGNRLEKIAIPTINLSLSMEMMPATVQMSGATQTHGSISSASDTKPPAGYNLPGGAIFAIIIGSIVGIILPIILLIQYVISGRRMKEEKAVLEEVLATGVANEKARNIGLRRLLNASSRKWAADHNVVHHERGGLNAPRAREKAKEERFLLQSLFDSRRTSDRN